MTDWSDIAMLGVAVHILAEAEIIVVTAEVIGFELIVDAGYAVEVLPGAWTGAIIESALDIGTGANASD